MSKIMTMGEILVEIMATRVGQSFRQAGQLVGPYPSGAPAIFIDQVAKLGHPCGIIGCVGQDDFGWVNIDRLKLDGADTATISLLENEVTGSAFVTYRTSGDRDFVFNIVHSASGHLSESMVTDEVLKDCSHFHVMGSSLFSTQIINAMRKAIRIVKGNGGTISFDPNIRKEMLRIEEMKIALESILDSADIFLPSGDEVSLLVNAASEAEAIDRLLQRGVKEVVVKHGKDGAAYYDRSQSFVVPAMQVEEVDPTGAGDCFGATYVTCRKMGMSPAESMCFAAASGACAVTRKGPMEGTTAFAELKEFMGVAKETSSPVGAG